VKKIRRHYSRLRRRGGLFERANYFLFCLDAAQTKQKTVRTLIFPFFGGEAANLYGFFLRNIVKVKHRLKFQFYHSKENRINFFKMNTIRIILFSTVLFFLNKNIHHAQTAHKLLRKGDSEYLDKNYKEAENLYKKAESTEGGGKAQYNLGNSIFNQQKYDEAISQYDKATSTLKDNHLKANSLYNKGNAHFWKKEYDKAVNAYKDALRLNPHDEDTKKNLSLAKRMLQEQQKQQEKDKDKQNQNNKDQQQKDDKDKQNQDQQNKDQQQKERQNQQQQNQDKNQDKNQNPQQNQQEQVRQNLQKDEAKRMLQIMDDEERKVQQRLRKGKPKPSRSSKDW
jgi:tetratricopeptide (TPR) repeat protein